MARPRVIILSGYGLNCEEETLFAFRKAGMDGDIRHINDLIATPGQLALYQAMAIPGGFSYGDDTGSGNAYANRLRHNLWHELLDFVNGDKLVIGICNGCQILVNLGLLPGFEGGEGERSVALLHNASARYQCRWVDLAVNRHSHSPWLKGMETLHIPVAHGEGRFAMPEDVLQLLEKQRQIAATYCAADGARAGGAFPANPNGAVADIAALTNHTGRVLGMMPHPERAIFFHQREDWPLLKEKYKRAGREVPEHGDGMKLFENAADYFMA